MAQYSITHSCGHTVTHNIVGTNVHDERERKADWLHSIPCGDCKRAAEQENAEKYELVALTGSEKQIAWAERIRAQAVEGMAKTLAEYEARVNKIVAEKPEQAERARQEIEKANVLWDRVLAQSSARWWIDHRGESAIQLLKEVSK